MERRQKIRMQLPNDLKETREYYKLKDDKLECAL